MNSLRRLILVAFCLTPIVSLQAQSIQTIFNGEHGHHGGYGAVSNKFTTIGGDFANMVEIYGGWFIHKKLLLGFGGGATTNDLPVAYEHRVNPNVETSYEYGQFGLMTEYVVASDRAVHVSFSLLSGAGFTTQYDRHTWDDWDADDFLDHDIERHDTQWFFVAEPGVQVELNIFKWMRFCPGVSYRFTQRADGKGIDDDDLRGASVALTLKFGAF